MTTNSSYRPVFLLRLCAILLTAFASRTACAQPPLIKPISIGETHTIRSRQLSEDRTLNIYLPEGYQNSDSMRYPVIYLLDGAINEDFLHVAGLVQYSSFSWIGWLKPSIVVGITTSNRRRDFTFPSLTSCKMEGFEACGGSAAYTRFIAKEVIPYIKNTFRTSGPTTIIGESLGGLLTTEILLSQPQLFDRYIIISPSLWWDNGSMLKRSANLLAAKKYATDIYLAVGKEGQTPGPAPRLMEDDVRGLRDIINNIRGAHIHLTFDYLPNENHATIAHQAILNAFRKMAVKSDKHQ